METGNVQVTVDSNMTDYGKFQPPMVLALEASKATLGDLLGQLAHKCPTIDFSRNKTLSCRIQSILVNGTVQYQLETNLSDGDRITIIFEIEPLGGG